MLDHPRLCHLMPYERVALAEFVSQLRDQFDDQITHVWLFGSKARGDFDEESDVDLLIVVSDGSDSLRRAIGDIAYALSLEHGVLLYEHMVSAWRFSQMRARQEPLYENMMREGIDLWTGEIASPSVAERRSSYDVGAPEDYLRHRLERSHEDLAWARGALERDQYRLALNRAYYAVFHLTSAVLASVDVVRHRHSGIESAFHQYLIKPGLIEPEYHHNETLRLPTPLSHSRAGSHARDFGHQIRRRGSRLCFAAQKSPSGRNLVVVIWAILQAGAPMARERRLPFRRRVHRGEDVPGAGWSRAYRRSPGAVLARARSHQEGAR